MPGKDATVFALVVLLTAVAALGQPPLPNARTVAAFLKQQFPKQAGYEVEFVRAVDDNALARRFQHNTLFQACVTMLFLETTMLPSETSCGLFATDGSRIVYLNGGHGEEKIRALLRSEQLPIATTDPSNLAEFFAKVLIKVDNAREVVLRSVKDLYKQGAGYVVDEDKVKPIGSRISRPIVRTEPSGWTLEFYALSGWMHQMDTVTFHRITISKDYKITRSEEVVAKGVYSRFPMIVY